MVRPEQGIDCGLSASRFAPPAQGIWQSETIFGPTLTLSTGRIIPTRWVGEQHVKEDLGFIPSFADWVKAIRPEPWMGRAARIETLVDPHLASPVVEVS